MKWETQNIGHSRLPQSRNDCSIYGLRRHVVTVLTPVNRNPQSPALFFVYATKHNQTSGRLCGEPEVRRRQPDSLRYPDRGLASPDAAAATYSCSAGMRPVLPADRRRQLTEIKLSTAAAVTQTWRLG